MAGAPPEPRDAMTAPDCPGKEPEYDNPFLALPLAAV